MEHARRSCSDSCADGGSIPPASTILQGNELRKIGKPVYNTAYNMGGEMRRRAPMFVSAGPSGLFRVLRAIPGFVALSRSCPPCP